MAWGEIGQIITSFATGATGALAMVKAIRLAEGRKAKKNPLELRCLRENCIRPTLFVNGEKEEIIGAIDRLEVAVRSRGREMAEMQEALHGIQLRLERGGI